MSAHTCPACGHTWQAVRLPSPPAKPRKFRPEDRDTSTMSDDQVRAYYAARALWDDCTFHASQGSTVAPLWLELRDAVERDGPTTAHKRTRDALRQQWRALQGYGLTAVEWEPEWIHQWTATVGGGLSVKRVRRVPEVEVEAEPL